MLSIISIEKINIEFNQLSNSLWLCCNKNVQKIKIRCKRVLSESNLLFTLWVTSQSAVTHTHTHDYTFFFGIFLFIITLANSIFDMAQFSLISIYCKSVPCCQVLSVLIYFVPYFVCWMRKFSNVYSSRLHSVHVLVFSSGSRCWTSCVVLFFSFRWNNIPRIVRQWWWWLLCIVK